MAKVTVRLQVRGVDLKEMMSGAVEQAGELSEAAWKITEIDVWGNEDIASRQGMARLWQASMTLEATV